MPATKGSVPWNAGTSNGWTDKRGYRWLYVTENGKRRARCEHRVVVEQSIGRRLEPWEVVHHKDGNPSNNAIDNLEVVEFGAHTAEHHAGSRKSYEARRSMEAFALCDKLSDILTRTANALKGEPKPRHRHGWHDLPDVAQKLVAAAGQNTVNAMLAHSRKSGKQRARAPLAKHAKEALK